MQVIDLKDTVNLHTFAMMYGASGTGKTHIIGTLCKLGTVLVIDIDQGVKTLKYAKDLQCKELDENVTVISFDQFRDLNEAYQLVKDNDPVKWSKKFGVTVAKPFDWIVWDTWSEVQWFMMQEVRRNNDRLGSGLNFRKNIEIQHWGQLTDLNKLSIEAFRDCKVNMILTFQETMSKDEVSGTIYGGPAIHGKLVQEVPAYFDIVVHTYTDAAGRYCATTKSKGKWPGKTRVGEGTDYVNPTAEQLFTA